MQTFHVYAARAYRCELSLFRAERVPASEALQIEAPADARELWRVAYADQADTIHANGAEALALLTGGRALGLSAIAVQ